MATHIAQLGGKEKLRNAEWRLSKVELGNEKVDFLFDWKYVLSSRFFNER